MVHVVPILLLLTLHQVSCDSHQRSLHIKDLKFRTIPTQLLIQTLNQYPGIIKLELTNNNIGNITSKDFPKSLSQITHLSLQANHIKHIENGAFKEMVNLVEINLGNNLLSNFPNLKAPLLQNMNLSHNRIQSIGGEALRNYKNLKKLVLDHNPLRYIHDTGLVGPTALKLLYIQNTLIAHLPSRGISMLTGINIEATPSLIKFPNAVYFTELKEANLTYSMHCCAFKYLKKQSSVSISTSNKTNLSQILSSKSKKVEELGEIKCRPRPNVFKPCDDILNTDVLRALSWLISISAIFLNVLLFIGLFQKGQKLSAPKLLIYNLGFANLLMGIYLFALCCADADTYGSYFNHVRGWQFSGSCQTFGFIAVFSINIAMCTLALLVLERFVLVNYFPQIGDEVKISHAAYSVFIAWIYSLLIAILPTSNQVSSYTGVAICLPMDIHNSISKGYVTWLLLSVVFVFIIIAYFLIHIFLKNRADVSDSSNDGANIFITKNLLFITCSNFLCWLTISAVGLSVLYTSFQFNVSTLHFLLVLFFPIHSIITPILCFIVNKPLRNHTWNLLYKCCSADDKGERKRAWTTHRSADKTKKNTGKKVENYMHIEVPQESRKLVPKHQVTVIDEHPETDDANASPTDPFKSKLEVSKSFKSTAHSSPYGESCSYSPRCLMDDGDNKRHRSISADNKRYSDSRHRSDTGTTVSTAVSANSNVELLEM